jgi:hypothetical protein
MRPPGPPCEPIPCPGRSPFPGVPHPTRIFASFAAFCLKILFACFFKKADRPPLSLQNQRSAIPYHPLESLLPLLPSVQKSSLLASVKKLTDHDQSSRISMRPTIPSTRIFASFAAFCLKNPLRCLLCKMLFAFFCSSPTGVYFDGVVFSGF